MYTSLQVNAMARYIQIIIISIIFLGVIILPVMTAGQQPGEAVFGGFLYNPLDGNSYLAKMRQGYDGQWGFVLPYTADHGDGAYIFLFYLFLGHMARWLSVSLPGMFHAARAIAGLWLLWQLWLFAHVSFGGDNQAVPRAVLLAGFGSGLGWLLFGGGELMPDFLVPEIYPFLSSYANPHFPLAMGLLLWVFRQVIPGGSIQRSGYLLLAGVSMAVLLPFAWGVGMAVLVVYALWVWWVERKFFWQPMVWLGMGGAPVVLYQVVVTAVRPILNLWNLQNLTPSPPIWEVGIALLPALLLAIYAIMKGWINWKENSPLTLSVIWLLTGLVLMYAPFQLQRRFMFALFIPTAVLAIAGLKMIPDQSMKLKRWLWPVVLILSLPSNLIVLFLGIYGIQTRAPSLYLSKYEYEALMWLDQSTDPETLILASPEMGNFIPAQTGRRVLYGHPFETVNAEEQEALITQFFNGVLTVAEAEELLVMQEVNLVFYGPREKSLGSISLEIFDFEIAYQNKEVSIYLVDPQ
jgi:hypothetical protein